MVIIKCIQQSLEDTHPWSETSIFVEEIFDVFDSAENATRPNVTSVPYAVSISASAKMFL